MRYRQVSREWDEVSSGLARTFELSTLQNSFQHKNTLSNNDKCGLVGVYSYIIWAVYLPHSRNLKELTTIIVASIHVSKQINILLLY